jgi:hypothetical protein
MILCKPDSRHGGLGARVDHAHHFDGRHQRTDFIGHLGFDRRRGAEAQALIDGGFHRGQDLGVGVTDDHRPPGVHVVYVTAVVLIGEISAAALLEKDRLAADGAKGAHRRVDSPGNMHLGRIKKLLGTVNGCLPLYSS